MLKSSLLTRLKQLSLSVLVAISCFHLTAEAKPYNHPDAGIQFDVPEDWSVETKGKALMVMPGDESFFILFKVSDAESKEDFDEEITEYLGQLDEAMNIEGAEAGEFQETEINGMPVVYVEGTGKLEGKEVNFEVSVIMATKPVIVFSLADSEAMESHKDDIAAFIQTIEPFDGE